MQKNVYGVDPSVHAATLDAIKAIRPTAEEKLRACKVFVEGLRISAAADVRELREANEHMRTEFEHHGGPCARSARPRLATRSTL